MFEVIQLIIRLTLPLEEIKIGRISVSHKETDQVYTMKEIAERDGPNSSLIISVALRNIHRIGSADGIF